MARLGAKLPGIYLETAELRPADELPRMDIAGFVGFAASGPLNLPVPVDDLNRFREIFGADVALARDPERGELQQSLLGPAVEAFFANGGRRAWIVRVADAARAVTLSWSLPGLVDGAGAPLTAPARSPGVWPAGLATDTRLLRARLLPGSDGLVTTATAWSLALVPAPEPPVLGDLIELVFRAGAVIALAVVDSVETLAGRTMLSGTEIFWRQRPASDQGPLGVENALLLDITDAAGEAAAGLPAAPDLAHRLSFELVVWQGSRIAARLSDLGFEARHPRFWGLLPGDAALFEPERGRPQPVRSPAATRLIAEAAAPRFPLAAPEPAPSLALPRGMRTVTEREGAGETVRPAGTALELDGLATFDDRLFLDPDLVRSLTGALLEAMEAKHSTSLYPFGVASDARLEGLHSLLTVQEVSMVAVPDAVHRRWTRSLAEPALALLAPILAEPVPEPDAFGRIALAWTPVLGAAGYRVEAAGDESFAGASVATSAEETLALPLPEGCPKFYAFRVRAERPDEIGPWSNVRTAVIPVEDFRACAVPPSLASVLLAVQTVGDPPRSILVWTREPPALPDSADRFELEEAITPTMDGAGTVRLDDPAATTHHPPPPADGARYYRVRLRRGAAAGPWSNTVRIEPRTRREWVLEAEGERDSPDASPPSPDASPPSMARRRDRETLTAVHRALIRFCAARADAVALLALPRHFREADISDHLASLLPQADFGEEGPVPAGELKVPPLTFGEDGALSYAALYHPWIATVSDIREGFQTADGPAAGLLARRSLTEGAWIAAANAPVAGAVALSPQFDRAVVARLIALQTNPAVRDARGFLFFNAETLSLTEELRPLPVRRLMILLRRLALREGMTYVFEPHSDDFRALVRRRFERLLSTIHQRGGLAGPTPEASFAVVTDESVNTRQATDLGRFLVELRVAPSRPFRFLNIRLLQTGPQQIEVKES
jgi:hypothetical protein